MVLVGPTKANFERACLLEKLGLRQHFYQKKKFSELLVLCCISPRSVTAGFAHQCGCGCEAGHSAWQWLDTTEHGSAMWAGAASCLGIVHCHNCVPGSCMWCMCNLTKISVSSELKLTGLEWVSPPENLWTLCIASVLGRKCLCCPDAHRWPFVYARGQVKWKLPARSLIFKEVPQHTPKSVRTDMSPICSQCCVSYFFLCCPFVQVAVSLKVVTLLPLTLPGSPMLNQLTFKALRS